MALLLVGVGCSAPRAAEPAAVVTAPPPTTRHSPDNRDEDEPERSHGKPGRVASAADLARLADEPQRLGDFVDPARGVTVIRVLGCEREDEIDHVERACGDAVAKALAPVMPGLGKQVRSALAHPDEPGIECIGAPDERCDVAPHGECEPTYRLFFDAGRLIAVVERDDWQAPPEFRRALDVRVRREVEATPRCGK